MAARFGVLTRPTAAASRITFGMVIMLSHVMTLSSGRPSATPTCTSDRMPRIVRVIGAHVTAFRTSMAASLVSTQTGRRPAGGPRSAQTMSPLVTTTGCCQRRACAPPRPVPDRGVSVGRPLGAPDQPGPHRLLRGGRERCGGRGRNGSSPRQGRAGPSQQRAGRRVGRELPCGPWTYGNAYGAAAGKLPGERGRFYHWRESRSTTSQGLYGPPAVGTRGRRQHRHCAFEALTRNCRDCADSSPGWAPSRPQRASTTTAADTSRRHPGRRHPGGGGPSGDRS
ncbi:MAG: hypothetical protein QOI99_1511 [Actinomycetota bacterium]|nr:hypothetical protein [Actinomycetota bacterium]